MLWVDPFLACQRPPRRLADRFRSSAPSPAGDPFLRGLRVLRGGAKRQVPRHHSQADLSEDLASKRVRSYKGQWPHPLLSSRSSLDGFGRRPALPTSSLTRLQLAVLA